jgi:acyl transferase domain-containing protein
MTGTSDAGNHIAVIGMACRYPGSGSLAEFWNNLTAGVEGISRFTREELERELEDPSLADEDDYVPARGVTEGGDWFDAGFFGYSPLEALVIDPQQRVFMECAWHALEHAGYDPGTFPNPIGVYAGMGATFHIALVAARGPKFMDSIDRWIANGHDFLATRTAYKLGLRGPAFTVQSACSTSLLATHLAVQGLLFGECDIALAGGVSLSFPQHVGYQVKQGSTSRDGHCRPFDAAADGTVPSEGVGIVVLKRLDDALADGDCIHAVIRGSAVNNDGTGKIGFTAPSVTGQAKVIQTALAVAEVDPRTVTYVETHGTGTRLGDPIEIAALTKVFGVGEYKPGFCRIGSVKSNIGHADAAAGAAGLIKTILTLEHGLLPPSLHFTNANPDINFADGPFRVNTELTEWKADGEPRRAGVNALGIGGTNVHVVLEEAPPVPPVVPVRRRQLLVLSAKTPTALNTATVELADHLRISPHRSLPRIAFTLQAGRRAHAYRRYVVAETAAEAAEKLRRTRTLPATRGHQGSRPVAFMFPGHGSHHAGMAREVYHAEPTFRADVDMCGAALRRHIGLDIRQLLDPERHAAGDQADVDQAGGSTAGRPADLATEHAALFTAEYALARLWMRWGVRPLAVIGHSIGEFAAACIAGVFELEDALRIVVNRARAIDSVPPGRMLAVGLAAERVRPLLSDGLSISVVNGPDQCVVSGPVEPAEKLAADLAARGTDARLLRTSAAGHSSVMLPVLPRFIGELRDVRLSRPTIPYVSNLTGTWVSGDEVCTVQYWADHLSNCVLFEAGLRTLLADPDRALIEVGPGRTLATLARRHDSYGGNHLVTPSLPHPKDQASDMAAMLTAAGKMWASGVTVDWAALHGPGPHPRRVPLPLYPFERQRFSLYHTDAQMAESTESAPTFPRPQMDQSYEAPATETERRMVAVFTELLGIGDVGRHDNFFELGGDSLIAIRLLRRVADVFAKTIPADVFYRDPTVEGIAGQVDAAAEDAAVEDHGE